MVSGRWPQTPALVVGRVAHTRSRPVFHRFAYLHYQWLIDADHPPQLKGPLRALASFRSSDHLSGGDLGIRHDLKEFLGARGIELVAGHRILMLCHGRQAGYVFDPLTLYWCVDAEDRLVATVAEVNNTYGDRHAYLVDPAGGVDKAMFVSPFNPSRGRYHFAINLGPERLTATVKLWETGAAADAGPQMVATVWGRLVRPSRLRILSTSLRHFPMTYRVWLLIRFNAIKLRLKGLRFLPVPEKEGSIR